MPKKRGSKTKTALSRNRPNPNKIRQPKEEEDLEGDISMTSVEGEGGTTTTTTTNTESEDGNSPGPCTSTFIRPNHCEKVKALQALSFKAGAQAIMEEIYEEDETDEGSDIVSRSRGKVKGKTGNLVEPKWTQFRHQDEASLNKESFRSCTEGTVQQMPNGRNAARTNITPEGSDVKFQRILDSIIGFPNLTEELEKTGKITNFITKCPEFREFEYQERAKLLKYKMESGSILKEFDSYVNLTLKIAKAEELMDMSVEDLIEIIEDSRNIKIVTFEDLLSNMMNLQGSDIARLKTRTSEANNSRLLEGGEEDLFDEYDKPITPPRPAWPLSSFKKVGSVPANKVTHFVFPTPNEMTRNVDKFQSPALFKFGSGNAPPSTSKAPRYAKPGDKILYSENGSPVLLPRLPRVPVGVPERILFTDNDDGKKIVEVVLYRGAEDKGKEYKDFVTDVRGMIATKSTIKKNRILPPRIPARGGPPSATKKTWQY